MDQKTNADSVQIPYKIYRDFKIPVTAKERFFDAAIDYKPKKDDIFIATYPKCGTTWVQHIVFLLFNKGRPATDVSEIIKAIPFPEQDGFPEGSEHIALKHHFPIGIAPFSNGSKHIYVVRNPMDTCVSYFHFLKQLPSYHIQSIDDFFEAFLNGQLPYGDYFEHLLSWSRCWDFPNVLFLTYEFMKQNHRDAVKVIASFLGLDEAIADENILNDVVRYSRSDFMRKLVDESDFMNSYLILTSSSCTRDVFNNLFSNGKTSENKACSTTKPKMIRKGDVKDFENHLSKSQIMKMKEVFVQKTKNTPAHSLWQDIFNNI